MMRSIDTFILWTTIYCFTEKEKTAEFLKPADVGVHPSSINQIHHGFGNSGNGTSLASGKTFGKLTNQS